MILLQRQLVTTYQCKHHPHPKWPTGKTFNPIHSVNQLVQLLLRNVMKYSPLQMVKWIIIYHSVTT